MMNRWTWKSWYLPWMFAVSLQLALTRVGHIHQVLHIFSKFNDEDTPQWWDGAWIRTFLWLIWQDMNRWTWKSWYLPWMFAVSLQLALTRVGHIHQVLHIFSKFNDEDTPQWWDGVWIRPFLRMMWQDLKGRTGQQANLAIWTTCVESSSFRSEFCAMMTLCWWAARDEWRTSCVNTHKNEADLLTKLLPFGEKQRKFVARLLRHNYPYSEPE